MIRTDFCHRTEIYTCKYSIFTQDLHISLALLMIGNDKH